MNKVKLLTWLIWGLIVMTVALLWWSAGKAEGEQVVYLPLVRKLPPSPRPVDISARVYNAIGQELPNGDVVWNELHVRVDAIGCSSVYPGFVGVDREIYPPTYYHLECTQPDFGPYSTQTTGADVIVFLNSPMWWSDFAINVYYPGGGLQTVMVKGPWWYGIGQ